MKLIRRVLFLMGILFAFVAFSWLYTRLQLDHAHSKGVYDSPETGMLSLIDKNYRPDHETKILYAGTNSFDGSKPFAWYVIAEVHASARADGSSMGKNGCDAPGSNFLQTKEGWVFVPEGAFPGFMSIWMDVFNMAGPGRSEPSTNWAAGQNSRFCLE
jgi:hypothetical protein